MCIKILIVVVKFHLNEKSNVNNENAREYFFFERSQETEQDYVEIEDHFLKQIAKKKV